MDNESDDTEVPNCELGRPLGDCQLRRSGCGSLYDVLTRLYPPQALLTELRSRQNLEPDVRQWLRQLDDVTAVEAPASSPAPTLDLLSYLLARAHNDPLAFR